MSVEVIISEGAQSGAPPLSGTAACASTVKRTSPPAGAEKLKPPARKAPTLGLLAGTTSVYFAQFAPVGLPVWQFVLSEMEINPVDGTAGVSAVAGAFCSGMFSCRVPPPDKVML